MILKKFMICLSLALLTASLLAAADLASAKQAYQQKNYDAAFKQLTPLAEKGDAEAQFLLGKMYWKGDGVLKDNDAAMKWFKASAGQGNRDAQFFTGSYYLLTHRDIPEGMKWMRLSAEQGNQDAQLLLGKTYMEGAPGVTRDPVQGEMWLRLAAKDNLPFYQSELSAAETHMSPDQIARGKTLAESWKPKSGLKPSSLPDGQSNPKQNPQE